MQKLLRRSPPSPILCTTINKPNTTCVLSIPFNNTPSHFISIAFNTTTNTTTTKNVLISSGLRMPTAASAFCGGSNISTAAAAAVSFSKKASNAVHGAFAGYSGISVGICNNHYVYLPIPEVLTSPRCVNPNSRMWHWCLTSTGQPDFY